jgi:hypothetical protein
LLDARAVPGLKPWHRAAPPLPRRRLACSRLSLSTTMTQPHTKLPLDGKTLAELQDLLTRTDAAIAERRIEELKVLADGYAKKLVLNGFTVQEGLAALKPYLPSRARRQAD